MTIVSRLEKIESSGLIRLAQEEPEVEYIFRHALVQDATYESLLRSDRRTLHQAVGRTLENLYADRLDEIAATLAFHFEKAEEPDKAVDYLTLAGEAASRVYAVNEAIELFGHALEIFPPSISSEKLRHLYSQYGRVLELAGRFDAVSDVYERMCAEGVKRQDAQMELDGLMSRAILHATPSPLHHFATAMQLCEQALAIALPLNHREAQSRIYWILMLNTLFDGHLKESVTYGEQALEIARSLNNTEQLAFILNDLVRVYHSNGMSEKGHVANLEARALWQKLGNLPMLVDNMVTASEYMFFNGEYERAIVMAQEAYEIGQSIQNIWGQTFCLMMLGFTYIELGELEKAIKANETLLAFDPRQTFKIAQLSSRAQLADIYKEVGDLKMAYQYGLSAIDEAKDLEPALQVAVKAGLASYELLHGNLFEAEMVMESLTELYDPENFTTFVPQYVESTRNDLLMYKGEFVAALEALDYILSVMERLKIVFCRDDFMLRKANALAALGRKDEALQVLQEAALGAESIHARRVLWKIYVRMNELQTELGDNAAAKVTGDKAREAIAFLCDHLPESLRRSFLQLPAVEKLLRE